MVSPMAASAQNLFQNPLLLYKTSVFFPPSTRRLLFLSPLRVIRSSPSFSWTQQSKDCSCGDNGEVDQTSVSRRQNSRSSTLLLLHDQREKKVDVFLQDEADKEKLQQKEVAEEKCLATRRIPRFPGSVDFPKEDALQALVELDGDFTIDDRAFKRALEVRRGVAAEVLNGALGAGRLGKTYSANVVSCLPRFIDKVVIEAAEMKALPEFAHLSFNARAKVYIQGSGVVELVKWLKHNSFTYPQIGKLICLCAKDLKPVWKLVEWLKSIHVKESILVMCL
ncbi:hypothetical protein HPP92_026666 [Vanilla planifolia]|uniref:Uncharacterized protein n=1 Tax=Vanilla planifolia TaxID=51239 RepID=A0A835PIN5_VANPL|nr:hypothetical protein HPP92_026666 [Vanilla planifolia]